MLETKKKFQLVERVLCALYAYLGFFHQGHTELANLEPSMRDLQVCTNRGCLSRPVVFEPLDQPAEAISIHFLNKKLCLFLPLQHQLHLSRREFAKDSRIGEAKRRQLEVHLSSALKVSLTKSDGHRQTYMCMYGSCSLLGCLAHLRPPPPACLVVLTGHPGAVGTG